MSVAGKGLMNRLGLRERDVKNSEINKLCAANNTDIKVYGKVEVKIEYEG